MRARPSSFLTLLLVLSVALMPATGFAKKKKKKKAAAEETTQVGPTVLADVDEGVVYKSWANFQPVADAAMKSVDEPGQVVTLFVQAMVARKMDKKLGEAMLGYLVTKKYQTKDVSSESGVTITRIFQEELAEPDAKPRILHAYCGGTPDGNYRDHNYAACVPVIDAEYSARMQGPKDGRAKYFITNAGASRPRPITLKDEDGIWRVDTVSGLMTGVAMSAEEVVERDAARDARKKD